MNVQTNRDSRQFYNNLYNFNFVVDIFVFRKRGSFLKLVKPGSMVNWLSEEPRSLLRAMSMTVCDLSAITKPWPIEKRVADLVTSEFFEQGDVERQELNITPIVSIQLFTITFELVLIFGLIRFFYFLY